MGGNSLGKKLGVSFHRGEGLQRTTVLRVGAHSNALGRGKGTVPSSVHTDGGNTAPWPPLEDRKRIVDQASEQTILKERKMKNEGQHGHHRSIYLVLSATWGPL